MPRPRFIDISFTLSAISLRFNMNAPRTFCFGSFSFDLHNKCLLQGTKKLPLEPKAIEVLKHLVLAAGQLVTTDRFLEVIWDNRVDESVLKRQISAIRKILSDDSAKPMYIETIRKYGYRFIADIFEQNGSLPLSGSIKDLSLDPPSLQADSANYDATISLSGKLFPAIASYINICGEWKIKTLNNGDTYIEEIRIARQDRSYFAGVLITPHPFKKSEKLIQDFHGQFVDRYTAFYTYQVRRQPFTKIGAGIFKLSMNHRSLNGKSVNLGITTESPSVATFYGTKKNEDRDDRAC